MCPRPVPLPGAPHGFSEPRFITQGAGLGMVLGRVWTPCEGKAAGMCSSRTGACHGVGTQLGSGGLRGFSLSGRLTRPCLREAFWQHLQ